MKAATKLSGEERRVAIVHAARRVFAEKGFRGTTTRELAEAAGVSEALLFKHFPTKEALYSAMQLTCCSEQDAHIIERIQALEPSTSTLVLMVHLLVTKLVGSQPRTDEETRHHFRLMLHSLVEDGEFARLLLRRIAEGWVAKAEECVRAAATADDAIRTPVQPQLSVWFTVHVATMIMSHLLPETPALDYGVPRDTLVEQVVWFALRGIGIKEEAIRRHYNPKALSLYFS